MIPLYSDKSQSFISTTDDIPERFCTCDSCGRHIHKQDRHFALNSEDRWYCTGYCLEEDRS